MKRGKREQVKNPSLHSYILSMLSLVLCCTMFMSATMAWFTSEVTTTGNQIYMGSLDVDLRDADGNTLHGKTGVLFDKVLLSTTDAGGNAVTTTVTHWQDNALALEALQVVNEGDLAFRYDLFLTVDTEGWSTTDLALLPSMTDQFEVWVLKDKLLSSEIFVDVTEKNSGWEMVKVTVTDAGGNSIPKDDTTLTDLLKPDAAIFSGTMQVDDVAGKKQTAHQYTVALRMKPSASGKVIVVDENGVETTVSIMGKTLILNAKLVANQLVDEEPSTASQSTGGEPVGGEPVEGQSAGGETNP